MSERAYRNPERFYPRSELGKIAFGVDGAVLDSDFADAAISRTWINPACARPLQCVLPRFLRLVPRTWRGCRECGRQPLPDPDPFPMAAEERRVADRRARRPILERWRIPARYEDASLLDGQQTPAVKAVRDHLELDGGDDEDDASGPGCLVLAGPTGTGKSYAAIAGFLHQTVWYPGESSAYYTGPGLARLFLGDECEEALERCSTAGLLVLDDLGAEYRKADGLVESLVEEALVNREADDLMTILATNLSITRFRDVMGDRVADRIAGPWGEWVSLGGQSMRRKPRPVKATA